MIRHLAFEFRHLHSFSMYRKFLLTLAFLSLPAFLWLFSRSETETLTDILQPYDQAGEHTKQDLSQIASLPIHEEDGVFRMEDNGKQGIDISYANQEKKEETPSVFSLVFPKESGKPLEIKLDEQRIITLEDLKNQDLTPSLLSDSSEESLSLWQKLKDRFKQREEASSYLAYSNQRKTILYTLKKDQATDEKKLKSWTLYQKGNGIEQEAYRIEHAQVKINEDGHAELFYWGDQALKNQEAQAQVEPSLLERAQRTLEQEMGSDILNSNQTPDLIIPKPFFYDKDGERHEAEWTWDETTKTLSLELTFQDDLYPIALDPTLQFTAPSTSNTGEVITGEAASQFGYAMASGDFNADGKVDLAVGASIYSANTGRVYLFYQDGGMSASAVGADGVITGEATDDFFSYFFASGDWNADGKTDLAVGAYGYSSSTGRAYIFYNDGSYPSAAASADIIITGETTANAFGGSLASGDWNADGKMDLAVGAAWYSSDTGRVYIFYNDGSIPTTAATADVIITGETAGDSFGFSLASGDWNTDGKTDLAVGARYYSSGTGRAYIFYSQNGQVNTNKSIAGGATGDKFGSTLAAGDVNADGRVDLIVSAPVYSSSTGRAYIFYNDGNYATSTTGADVTITGQAASDLFGGAIATGDWNADGKADLVIGAIGASGNQGRAYIFWNDGSIPTTAATADVIITGITGNDNFGNAFTLGDFNADGKKDLVVGAWQYYSGSGTGFVYIFYNGSIITESASGADIAITGDGTTARFGVALNTGDFNADGKVDLVVGAYGASSNAGRAYVFYNDGSIPTTAATADVTITGEASTIFGTALEVGDFNADGATDLLVSASGYNSSSGRVYLFYNDGSIPTTAATADVIIDPGVNYETFGYALVSGDFNADGRVDFAASAYGLYGATIGNTYIFYNDGAYPTVATSADVKIAGEAAGNLFGSSLVSGDFNVDGRTDLVVGAYGNTSNTGKIYFYETRENFSWKLQSVPLTTPFRTQTGSGAGEELSIMGEASSSLGSAFAAGDFNADGKMDLVVGAQSYSSNSGRVYIFYNDGSLSASATSADVVITGATSYYFGHALEAGDLNSDGKTDLIVGTYSLDMYVNRAYVFYNDGSYPSTYTSADISLTGEGSSGFGYSLAVGDWNTDGRIDLAVGADLYSSGTGRAYIFYNDGSIPTTAATADVIITGEATGYSFGFALGAGDWNADGKIDLAVGATSHATITGRAYIFYNDGSIPTAAGSADAIITGNSTWSYFGSAFAAVDCNADGKQDLVVGAMGVGAYIFYNDGSYPSAAASADIVISGSGDYFGASIASGDFNADGKVDLAFSGHSYATYTGRAYIFYNDGSIPTTAATADIILTGETTGGYFGIALAAGDFNTDGKIDLVVGADHYASSKGKVYLYTWNDATITGETTSNYFGGAMTSGDWNADGKIDLAIGAYGYSSNTGRAYIFYNDSTYPSGAASADVIITGGAAGDYFGIALTSGDLNADGKTDLAVGARYYSSGTGRAYIFYNDGSIPTTAATADVTITGTAASDSFGSGLTTGDLNTDGRTDLVVGSSGYNSGGGRAYIFYNDGSIPTTAATADVTISGDMGSGYGLANGGLVTGDFNADGRTDLAVGGASYSSYFGRVNIFYNDGSIPTTAATSDVTIFGTAANEYFGTSLVAGDFNVDGKIDLAVSGWYSSKVFVFYNDGSYPALSSGAEVQITGSNDFGKSLVAGDFNADGRTDLAAGANGYGGNFGLLFVFYNDGSYPSVQASADYISEATPGLFGQSLASGDFNSDGKTDIAVGAYNYSTDTGRAYIITTEAKVDAQAGVRARGITRIRGNFMMKR